MAWTLLLLLVLFFCSSPDLSLGMDSLLLFVLYKHHSIFLIKFLTNILKILVSIFR